MKSTPERVEALRDAESYMPVTQLTTRRLLAEMLSECEQELPKPLVFEPKEIERLVWDGSRYPAQFNRKLTDEDFQAIRAALTKAFPP